MSYINNVKIIIVNDMKYNKKIVANSNHDIHL